MVTQSLALVLALISGLILGAFYFGGLWITLQRLPYAKRPALWTFTSLVARTAVLLSGFYLVMDGRWERLAACLVGFILLRTLFVRRLRPAPAQTVQR